MSDDHTIDKVNDSGADFLAVSLGARKGQLWLFRNHRRLTIPIRVHLGTVVNFQAGTVTRAPSWLRGCGLEWLWRIKEEPFLWRRYTHDGFVLLHLLCTRILPLTVLNRWNKLKSDRQPKELLISTEQHHDCVTIRLSGDANQRNIGRAIACFQETLTKGSGYVVIDLAGTRVIDGRFLGLLLMLRKHLKGQGAKLRFVGVSPMMRRLFWLNEVDFLLNGAIEKA
jgi:N-acetylglucosaminyldiphosphoundecaprenol N-acetyl-beta-D-mannosaminyltransferase